MFSEKQLDDILSSLFHLKKISIEWENIFFSPKCTREITMLSSIINEKAKTNEEKIALITKIQKTTFKSNCINEALSTLLKVYNKKQQVK